MYPEEAFFSMTMRKFFWKRFKHFFLVMLIPLLVLTAVSMGFQYKSSMNVLTAESANALTRMDENLNGAISTSAYQYELMTYNPRLVLSLKKFFQHETFSYSDVVLLNSIRTMMGSVAQSHDFIASIYLYLDGYEDYFSTSDGFLSIENGTDFDWYPMYQSMDKKSRLWITKREFQEYSYIAPTRYITVYQRMGNISGVTVVNIRVSDLQETFDTNTSVNHEYLYLLDSSFQVLTANSAGNSLSETFADYSQTHDLLSRSDTWITLNGQRYFLEVRKNNDFGTSFAALIPRKQVFAMQKTSLFFLIEALICNCLVTLFLAYMTTKRNFEKIDEIIHTFDNAEKGILPPVRTEGISSRERDEYDVILDNIIGVFLKSSYLQRELSEKQYKQEIAEKAALQLQINPHFLFNTLQSLDFTALELTKVPTILNRMIHNLSDILKYSLEDPGKAVRLQDELAYLKEYVEIQKVRYGNQFIIYYEVDEDLMDMELPRLILQPLVENSISHGVASLEEGGYIKVRIYRRNGHTHFVVIDSGIGLDKEEIRRLYAHIQDENSRNIGLTNVNRRLTLHYGNTSALHIQGKKGLGTCISFIL